MSVCVLLSADKVPSVAGPVEWFVQTPIVPVIQTQERNDRIRDLFLRRCTPPAEGGVGQETGRFSLGAICHGLAEGVTGGHILVSNLVPLLAHSVAVR